MTHRIDIRSLFYITHIKNMPSILKNGILSHDLIETQKIPFTPIYDSEIIGKRKLKSTSDNRSLWEYANLYFQPRNLMMYRVTHEKSKQDLVVIGVKASILQQPNVFVTDGNAANAPTQFFKADDGIKAIESLWKEIHSEWWSELDGSKRKIMAECLVPERILPDCIHTIFVTDHNTKKRLENLIGAISIPIVPEPNFFFQPAMAKRIGKNISLIEGDMFFSNMQTLTVSVNLQEIMGKGLASRAKYQFPDLYVFYQDACRSRQLTATKPCLYKREASLDKELADLTTPLETPNAVKWFLLFATKRKWRENSRLDDIEKGLEWLKNNFLSEGIKSIALPALGCGLGGLSWDVVGRLMCHYLRDIGIEVAIYLPRERLIDRKFLSEEYLLVSSS